MSEQVKLDALVEWLIDGGAEVFLKNKRDEREERETKTSACFLFFIFLHVFVLILIHTTTKTQPPLTKRGHTPLALLFFLVSIYGDENLWHAR